MVNPQPTQNVEPDPLTSANLERLSNSPSATRSAPSTIGRHQDRAPFSRKLTKSLFLRPAHLIGPAPSYSESLKSALTYSFINVLLVFNPIAWALHYTHQNAGATFAVALLGIVPLAGLLGHGTETIAMYTGDALGGLINASLGNATEFIIAILLLVKCELRVVQASLLGGLLSNLLLVTGMAFLVGGFRFNEMEFQQTAAQLNTSLMTLAVIALVLPTVFAFAIEAASGEDQERRLVLEMSRGASLILILIYISYMVFQLYSHSYLYNPDAEYEIRSSSSSSSSSSRSSSPEPSPAPVNHAHQLSPTIEKAEPQLDAKDEAQSSAAVPAAPPTAGTTPKSPRRPRVHMQASERPPVAGETHHTHLVPPRLAPRRANSLPFGSAAALGRGSRDPIHPMNGAATRESEKALELRSRTVHRRPLANAAADVEHQTVASTHHEPETPEMNMTTAILVLLATTGLTYLTAEALTDALEQIGNVSLRVFSDAPSLNMLSYSPELSARNGSDLSFSLSSVMPLSM
jgi:Ca2+:H+ antiporter